MPRGALRPGLLGWAFLIACVALLYLLRNVLTPILIALALAYMLDPLVDRLEALRVPRSLGIVVLLVLALALLVLFGVLVLPAVVADLAALLSALPEALGRALARVEPFLADRGVAIPSTGSEAIAAFETYAKGLAPGAMGAAQGALSGLLGGTASVFGALAAGLIVPVIAFYLLRDFDLMVAAAVELLPQDRRESVVALGREIDEVLGQFVRGQLTVMVILAALYAVGYSLVGVPLAVPIGVVAGLLSFIPYVGGGLSLGLASLMVALHWQGVGQLLGVVAVYGMVQLLEGLLITPKIVGDKLGLPAVFVLIALMVGAELLGFVGIMVALPAAAVIKVLSAHAVRRYRESALYAGAAGAAQPRAPGRLKRRRVSPLASRRRDRSPA